MNIYNVLGEGKKDDKLSKRTLQSRQLELINRQTFTNAVNCNCFLVSNHVQLSMHILHALYTITNKTLSCR